MVKIGPLTRLSKSHPKNPGNGRLKLEAALQGGSNLVATLCRRNQTETIHGQQYIYMETTL